MTAEAPPSALTGPPPAAVRLGISDNLLQFSLLVVVNAMVGAMVGMERAILPQIAEAEFHLVAKTAVLSFIVVFGITKAFANAVSGRLSDALGRRGVLVAGWLVAAPVPFALMWAPSWGVVLAANALLGVSQGLTWSTTVIMKIDLAGPKQRGFAMGINEFAGYVAVGVSALLTGFVAAEFGLRPEPFFLGVGYVVVGLGLSLLLVKDTRGHVAAEIAQRAAAATAAGTAHDDVVSGAEVFARTTFSDPTLSSVSQAGLVNNLNDGMAWGLFPLLYAATNLDIATVGVLAALYPMTWGVCQLFTGAWSDRVGRKPLIVAGMWLQAVGIAVVAVSVGVVGFGAGAVLMGVGTAMVYPTFLAAIADVAQPSWRASAVGVYRMWRDLGYAVGAVTAGLVADQFGVTAAVWVVASLTFASGAVVAVRMPGRTSST